MSNFDSREAALVAAIQHQKTLDFPIVESSLNELIEQAWDYYNLIKPTLSEADARMRRKSLYHLELLLLTVCKSRRS